MTYRFDKQCFTRFDAFPAAGVRRDAELGYSLYLDLMAETSGSVNVQGTKVFISWSGEGSKRVATALFNWLPLVLHHATPWMSSESIDAGKRWNPELAHELEACDHGIVCVTPENINAPWMLFEAGALAKSLNGRVIPLLFGLDIKDLSGPLMQFQAMKLDRGGVYDLVTSVNSAASSPVNLDKLNKLFDMAWPSLEQDVSSIPSTSTSGSSTRSESDILEELVVRIRSLDSRLRSITPRKSGGQVNLFAIPEAAYTGESILKDEVALNLSTLSMFAGRAYYFAPELVEIAAEALMHYEDGDLTRCKSDLESLKQSAQYVINHPDMPDKPTLKKVLFLVIQHVDNLLSILNKPTED